MCVVNKRRERKKERKKNYRNPPPSRICRYSDMQEGGHAGMRGVSISLPLLMLTRPIYLIGRNYTYVCMDLNYRRRTAQPTRN